jgi:glyoxylase-like metal-dependent hydrolase (beta-lactamase superfamily II)
VSIARTLVIWILGGLWITADTQHVMPTPSATSEVENSSNDLQLRTPTSSLGDVDIVAEPTHREYSIKAIRYASMDNIPLSQLVMGLSSDEKVTTAMMIWLIKGNGHAILFDSGFHHDTFSKSFPLKEYMRPDEAVKLAGEEPDQITDIVISHAHWDHMGGLDLFPHAQVWIQAEEYRYYTMTAWQPEGHNGGVDPLDVAELVRANTQGRLHLISGDDVELFPGIRAYIGGHHTFASQYLRVDGKLPCVLASDNSYLYLNLSTHHASATFSKSDEEANIANQDRMIKLAGTADRVVPGHDMLQFEKYPATGRVATIQ